ncbi:hypothetical protein CkaCkLH20_13232 [Colletotrichum karsti]|uniref:Uncharacterized protein n=1 Tax=Colletotrichum karsti TaxID=1095194 RepID=A0A9P6HT05_9PEZI|nr:uncharacterized protein CkaCkLH20_13232 [Colletotrichum karsti]KAF9869315.1 hypothetical protein CkaCkLH20_13232 [Colletotrichum karsti]
MAKFSDLPIDILMEICDFLLHRGTTIEEVFAKAHVAFCIEPTLLEDIIALTLQQGHSSVVALSQVSPSYEPLLQCLDRTLSLHGKTFLSDAVRFLKLIDSKPEIAQRVKIVYLNLEEKDCADADFDGQTVDYLRQLAENGGIPWSEEPSCHLPVSYVFSGSTLEDRINTVARILIGRLPNVEQLGLSLPALPLGYHDNPKRSPESNVVLKRLKHLALRTYSPVMSRNVRRGYRILEDLAVTPTHLFLQDPFLCHVGIGPTAKPFSHLFQHVTHLILGGQMTHEGDHESEIIHMIECCAPLQDFRCEAPMRNHDSGTHGALAIINSLKKQHATSLRTLAIRFCQGWLEDDLDCIEFTSFINLENLCMTTACIKKRQVGRAKDDATRTEGTITTLPKSLIQIYFLDYPQCIADELKWLASHREALPNLKLVHFWDTRMWNEWGGWEDTESDALVNSGLNVLPLTCDAVDWQV